MTTNIISYAFSGSKTCYHDNLINAFGLSAAALLTKVHYWANLPSNKHLHLGHKWVYNTFDAWAKQIKVSSKTIQRATKRLRELGILRTGNFNRLQVDRTFWYSIDYERLDSFVYRRNGHDVHLQVDTMSTPIPINNNKEIINNNTSTNALEIPDPFELVDVPIDERKQTNNKTESPPDPIPEDLEVVCRDWGYDQRLLVKLICTHGIDFVREKVQITKESNPKNHAAYLTYAIKQNIQAKAKLSEQTHTKPSSEYKKFTKDENRAWYQSMTEAQKQDLLRVATNKFPYLEHHLKSNNLDPLQNDFVGHWVFGTFMDTIGRPSGVSFNEIVGISS